MEQSPSGLSVTFTWNTRGSARSRSVALGSALRVALMLSLSAACYEVGRWRTRIEDLDSRPDNRVVIVERTAKPGPAEVRGIAAGDSLGAEDKITPLNARDPSALVIGPLIPPPPPAAVPSPAPEANPSRIPEAPRPPRIYRKLEDIKPTRRF
jgi:hypothetical protein